MFCRLTFWHQKVIDWIMFFRVCLSLKSWFQSILEWIPEAFPEGSLSTLLFMSECVQALNSFIVMNDDG